MRPDQSPQGVPAGGFNEIHVAARNRIEPNGDGGNTALWFVAQGGTRDGQTTAAGLLIDAGADVNAVCEHGTTAAHLACSWGHEDLLKLLGEAGADLSIRDSDGMTPEMVARAGYDWQLTRVSAEQRAGVVAFFDLRS